MYMFEIVKKCKISLPAQVSVTGPLVLWLSFKEVARFSREFCCCKGCCWCADGSCGWQVEVESPVGNPLGYVEQRYIFLVDSDIPLISKQLFMALNAIN